MTLSVLSDFSLFLTLTEESGIDPYSVIMLMQITDFIQGRGEANHESILSGYLKQGSVSVAVFFGGVLNVGLYM